MILKDIEQYIITISIWFLMYFEERSLCRTEMKQSHCKFFVISFDESVPVW